MKHLLITLLGLLLIAPASFAQKIEELDFSSVWTSVNSDQIVGIIGDDYRRIQVHFISVIKDVDHPREYFVHGKTMVHNNVCDFQGKIIINELVPDMIPDFEGRNAFIVKASYRFFEDPAQFHVGFFDGLLVSYVMLDEKGKVQYNDILMAADGFNNNLFIGTWSEYNTSTSKKCNWGDYRIPQSGDLDIGAGEFSPNPKYDRKGWVNFNSDASVKKDRNWWE